MNALDQLVIQRSCERLVTLYTHYADFGSAERIAELFAEDGVWEAGAEIRFEGQSAIAQMMQGRRDMVGRRSRHVCTNLHVEVLDEDHARGLVYLSLYRHDFETDETTNGPALETAPTAVGQYHDEFIRTEAGWRFQMRRAEIAFGTL